MSGMYSGISSDSSVQERNRRPPSLSGCYLGSPGLPPDVGHRLEVYVIYTDIPATLAALKTAGELAHQLHARIHLLVPHVVPYPRPLESPPVAADFTDKKFRTLAGGQPVETDVQVALCRDPKEHLLRTLRPRCLAVLGGKSGWFGFRWFRKERKLAKALERRRVHVVFVSV